MDTLDQAQSRRGAGLALFKLRDALAGVRVLEGMRVLDVRCGQRSRRGGRTLGDGDGEARGREDRLEPDGPEQGVRVVGHGIDADLCEEVMCSLLSESPGESAQAEICGAAYTVLFSGLERGYDSCEFSEDPITERSRQ